MRASGEPSCWHASATSWGTGASHPACSSPFCLDKPAWLIVGLECVVKKRSVVHAKVAIDLLEVGEVPIQCREQRLDKQRLRVRLVHRFRSLQRFGSGNNVTPRRLSNRRARVRRPRAIGGPCRRPASDRRWWPQGRGAEFRGRASPGPVSQTTINGPGRPPESLPPSGRCRPSRSAIPLSTRASLPVRGRCFR